MSKQKQKQPDSLAHIVTESNIKSPTHMVDGEYIKEWLVLGPFFPEDMDLDFLVDVGGEANINPKEGDTATTADGETLRWKRYKSRTRVIKVINAIGYSDGSIAYAFCLLKSEMAGNFQIEVWSSDGGAVWINGKRVAYSPLLDYQVGLRSVDNVDLEAGVNRCLVKTPRGTGPWGFNIRILPPNRGEISGIIADEKGKPIHGAHVRLEQDERPIMGGWTDASGTYRLGVHPVHGKYDLSATKDERGLWQLGIPLSEGERQTLNLTLREAVSIEGTLLMLDGKTPHKTVSVQAVRNGEAIDRALSDANGKYRFINLKPGEYQVRCHVLGEHIYYGEEEARELGNQEIGRSGSEAAAGKPASLQVQMGRTLNNINFRFPPFRKGIWRTYSTLNGLPSNGIRKIYRAPEGMMWFTTVGGVSCYDGNQFVNFTEKDGLASNSVFAIYCDANGVMWFGTHGGGVSRYDGREFVNFTTEDGLALNWITGIDCAPEGAMWFGTYGGGASRYDGKEFVTFTAEDGLEHNQIIDVHCDPNGAVWFGTQGYGVTRYDGKEFVNLTTDDGLAGHHVSAIQGDSDGVMWFGTFPGGVSRYDGKEFVNLTPKDGLLDNDVFAIHRAPDGVMWFAGHIGISRYDGKTFVNFTTEEGLAHNEVWDMYCDPDGVMWFATNGAISRYDMKSLVNFTVEDGLPSNDILSSCCTPDGVMWFGTNQGVSRCDSGDMGDFPHFVNFTTKDGLASNRVNAIYRDPDGAMWFATDAGVSRYDGKEFLNLTARDGLLGGWIRTIHSDPDGVVWFGSRWGGVSRYDGKSFRNFTTKDGLAANNVQDIYRDTDGVMWVWASGMEGEGLSRYDGKKFIDSGIGDQLGAKRIMTIYCDTDGVTWFGTQGGGVCRYDGKEFISLTTEDGLAHNLVRCIYRDADGVMWFGTAAGVSRYDGSTWTSLDTRDGLAGDIVLAIHRDSNGYLWFGTGRGATRYRPTTTPPKVRIISVQTMEQRYTDLTAIPTIVVGQYIAIECSAIDFKTLPEKRQYRYRIKELDLDWRKATKAAHFEWIPQKAGTYTFEVQAIDRDLNYSKPASVELEVIDDPRDEQIAQLESELARRNRELEAELQDAHNVQMSLMPETAPPIEGVQIAGKCIPANTVSGDFFDYLVGKTNEVTLVVADVCGKAMKGAMNAVMTDGILHTAAIEQEEFTPASLMMTLNNALKGRLARYMNVTMVIGMIDAESQTLSLSNAGHHAHPLLLRHGEVQILKMGGMPLGMRAGIQYAEEQFQLESGDVAVFMTDGIIEAMDGEANYYADSGRLEKIIGQFTPQMPASAMVEAVITDAIDFGGDKANRDDDMTVVVAKVL